MSALIADFFSFFWVVVEMMTAFYFFMGFLRQKAGLVYGLVCAAAVAAVLGVCETGGVAEFAGCVLLLTVVGKMAGRKKWSTVLPYAVVVVEIVELSNGIFNPLLAVLSPVLLSALPDLGGYVLAALGNGGAFVVLVFCCRLIRRYFPCNEAEVVEKYTFMIFLPVLLLFLVNRYIGSHVYGNPVVTRTRGMAAAGGGDWIQILAIESMEIICLFCFLYAYKKVLEGLRLRERAFMMEQEAGYLQAYVEEAKLRYEKTRAFRHDVRNHMTVVRELLQKGGTKEALAYLRELENMTRDLAFACSTNRPVLDILIGNKLGIARESGISVSCRLVIPCSCGVSDIDFCIIFSNGLDNAVRACGELEEDVDKYIVVSGKVQGDFLLLEIENSFTGKTGFRKGIGLVNIEAVAEKYGGVVTIDTDRNRFILSVLLIIPQHPEDSLHQTAAGEEKESRNLS